MAKKINPIIIGLIIIGVVWAISSGTLFQGAVTGSETMTRTGPSSVDVGSTFQITYEVLGASGTWGASIEDDISGGCTFPSGRADIKTVMLSEEGTTKTLTVQSPQTAATCTFSGNYKFGELGVINLNSYSVTVESCTPSCTRPADMCLQASSVLDGCGGNCAGEWTVNQNTEADTNCDNTVNRNELGTAITEWINGEFGRTELGQAIVVWAGG